MPGSDGHGHWLVSRPTQSFAVGIMDYGSAQTLVNSIGSSGKRWQKVEERGENYVSTDQLQALEPIGLAVN